jgi:uncharacterized membrane protein
MEESKAINRIGINVKLEKKVKFFLQKIGRSKKLKKTITYRISASILAQVVGVILFRSIEVNTGILIADLVQMIWYFYHERLWERRIINGTN